MRETILIMLAVLVSLAAPALGAHETQNGMTFILTAEDGEGGLGKIMLQDEHPQDGEVSLSPTRDCETWLADQPAGLDRTFTDQTVDYSLSTALGQAVELQGILGIFSGDTFTEVANTTGATGTFEGVTFTVDQGDHLAFRVCANFGTTSTLADIQTDGSSYLTFAEDAPEYPTPEIGTLALSTIGMIGLVGAARFQRED